MKMIIPICDQISEDHEDFYDDEVFVMQEDQLYEEMLQEASFVSDSLCGAFAESDIDLKVRLGMQGDCIS